MKTKDLERLLNAAKETGTQTISMSLKDAERILEDMKVLKMLHDNSKTTNHYFLYCTIPFKEEDAFDKCWQRMREDESEEEEREKTENPFKFPLVEESQNYATYKGIPIRYAIEYDNGVVLLSSATEIDWMKERMEKECKNPRIVSIGSGDGKEGK